MAPRRYLIINDMPVLNVSVRMAKWLVPCITGREGLGSILGAGKQASNLVENNEHQLLSLD